MSDKLKFVGHERNYARQYRSAVWRLQKSQLRHYQKQEENDAAFGVQKVLSFLP